MKKDDKREGFHPSRIQSLVASSRRALRPVCSQYAAFCNETTLHGLKHTVAPQLHWFERFLWVILTVCAFVGAVYCALSQLARYNSEPVVVSLQRDYRSWRTTFPAVTACFLNRVDIEKANEVIETNWNVTEESNPEKFQYYMGFIELVADVSFRTNLQNFWKYQTDETVNDIDLLQLALSVHPTLPLKVMVSQSNKEVQWIPVMTEVGMCLTFNSEYAQFQFMLTDVEWMGEELLKCHYHSRQCFVRIDSMNNAIRYFVHSPFEISTAISNPTGEIMPGEELIIDFKTIEIQAAPGVKNLRPDQRRCRYPDEWLSDTIQAYSFGLCQMHCRSRMAIMFCGCRPFFHVKGDGDLCDAHGMACIGRNVEILINLPKNLAKCSCLPLCAEYNYYSHTKKVLVRNSTQTESEEGMVAAVRFNLMPPKFRLHRDVIFTLEDLFGKTLRVPGIGHCQEKDVFPHLRDFLEFSVQIYLASLGGTTALFVGASVLTVVETVLFLLRWILSAICGRKLGRIREFKEFKP